MSDNIPATSTVATAASTAAGAAFALRRDSFGLLVYAGADGVEHTGVVPVRAFPISAPADGVALINAEGHELLWIEQLAALPVELCALINEELANRELIPEIRSVRSVSSFATPSVWRIATDRGETEIVLRSEDDIRRLASPALLIADAHGLHFLIRDRYALDAHSRKLLDRFL
ncbi:cyanophycin metabolism-associated DUF1854 family protein [Rhodocyclus tenuis]|uniref:DUF1854 domain-containing protein n=1 Tax=Rhodocyclus tenuis TaxID=1066 RepID=A0A840GHU9_RHOTE|nr:DUF1854 domain-containing protein [Rhodocyclus tenuis]MBB4247759.1 hypothetical protein [Rhodocyclus tenuis]